MTSSNVPFSLHRHMVASMQIVECTIFPTVSSISSEIIELAILFGRQWFELYGTVDPFLRLVMFIVWMVMDIRRWTKISNVKHSKFLGIVDSLLQFSYLVQMVVDIHVFFVWQALRQLFIVGMLMDLRQWHKNFKRKTLEILGIVDPLFQLLAHWTARGSRSCFASFTPLSSCHFSM